MQVKTKED
jgi:hypothetical protein